MKRLRLGVIGLGVGERHVEAFNAHPQCEVTALCDFDDDKIAAAREMHPHAKILTQAEELLDDPDIDAVSVASWDNYHYEQVLRAIENGKHVFVEKPLCLHEHELAELKAAHRKHPGLKISSNLVLRTCPRFRALRNEVRDGRYGTPYYIEADYNYGRIHKIMEGWRGKLDYYSVFLGGAVHMVDLVMWLTGERPVEVKAVGGKVCTKGSHFDEDDLVVALLTFESGMVAKIAANFGCVQPHFHRLDLYGTKASFMNDLPHARRWTTRDKGSRPEDITEAYAKYPKGEVAVSFVESILNGKEPLVSPADVFSVMSVCFAVEKAKETGASTTIKYD